MVTHSPSPARIGFRILGTGAYLPRNVLKSTEIDARLGFPRGTTESRHKIAQRHVASPDETSSTMAAKACEAALDAAGIAPESVDLILGGCGVMEQAIPSTAALVQARLGLETSGIPSYDVNATCLSFLQAFELAALKLASGQAERALVFSADIASVGLDWSEPETASIFGDGAAAVVIEAAPAGTGSGLLASRLETYSEGRDACQLTGGGTRMGQMQSEAELSKAKYFQMDGALAYRSTARRLPRFVMRLLAQAGITRDDLDCIIPHQASAQALDHAASALGLSADRLQRGFARLGNQIATSIPMMLHEAITSKKLQPGDLALLIGTSAGVSLGGMVVRY